MASVVLKNVSKVYPPAEWAKIRKKDQASDQNALPQLSEKGFAAVTDFNLEIKDKEFVVLVGPSGCGKSTTLRMIAGLEEITGGELYIDDRLVNEIEPKDRDVAMVFQNYALYPHMTVYNNIAFALKKRIKSKEEIDRKVREAAEILGITEYLDRKPKSLSGGQRQRVAIGRAIVRNPKVMLMDEPLSNLDAKLRNQMREELLTLRSRIDTTFVYVTHDQTEAMTLGDRIVIMKDGFIQQVGTPQEVFENPANTFVAGFIGTPQMNFFDASLERDGDTYTVRMGNFHAEVGEEAAKKLAFNNVMGGEITLGVRPESIIETEDDVSFAARVGVMELMGSSVHIHLEHNGKKAIMVTQVLGDNGKLKMDYKSGSIMRFRFAREAMYLFDRQTGKNLEV